MRGFCAWTWTDEDDLVIRCACRGKDRLSADFVRAAVDMGSTLLTDSVTAREDEDTNCMRARTSVIWTIAFMDA